MLYVSGGKYSGQWSNDQRHGSGKMEFGTRVGATSADGFGLCGVSYKGEFAFGMFEGRGMLEIDTSLCSWRPGDGSKLDSPDRLPVLIYDGTWQQGKLLPNSTSVAAGECASLMAASDEQRDAL